MQHNGQDNLRRYWGISIDLSDRPEGLWGIPIVLSDRPEGLWGIPIVLSDRPEGLWGIPIVLSDRPEGSWGIPNNGPDGLARYVPSSNGVPADPDALSKPYVGARSAGIGDCLKPLLGDRNCGQPIRER